MENSARSRTGARERELFYKVESTTALMPRQMYEERLRLSNPRRFSWENTPNPEIALEDIDAELLYQTLHDGIGSRRIHASAMTLQNPESILVKLGVARKDGILLNAANVLFGKEPSLLHIQCKVRLARFEGTDKRVFRDQTVCEGNLFEQYDAVIDFCLKHLHLSGTMDSKFRQDTLTVPYAAVKEAAVNMLCHRSWNAENMTPSLAIYDDRMVFQNPGAFPMGTTWKDFVDNQIGSLPTNPTIANVFYRRGTMEAWGRGISLIMESCVAQGLPEPEISVAASFVNLTIWFGQVLKPQGEGNGDAASPQVTPQVTPQVENQGSESQKLILETFPQVTPQVTPQVAPRSGAAGRMKTYGEVLQFCENPRSLQEIMEYVGLKDRKWVREKYILPMLGGLLELTIPDKPNSRLQKYRRIEP